MGGDTGTDGTNPRDEDLAPSGQVDSDDTTQADAGMAGGTGADEGQASATPMGTEPHDDDQDAAGA